MSALPDDVMDAARLIAGCVEDDDDCATHEPCAWPCRSQAVERIARLITSRERAAAARALKEAAHAWQTGGWSALAATARKGGPSGVLGSAQAVTGWLRDRADESEAGGR